MRRKIHDRLRGLLLNRGVDAHVTVERVEFWRVTVRGGYDPCEIHASEVDLMNLFPEECFEFDVEY